MKFPLIFLLALVINGVLFYLMQAMITGQKYRFNDLKIAQVIDFVRMPDQTKPLPTRSLRSPPPEPRPQPIAAHQQSSLPRKGGATVRSIPLPLPALKVDIPLSSNLDLAADPYLPSVMVEGENPSPGNIPGDENFGLLGTIMASELVAIAKASPFYPRVARSRRIEGYVLIDFTVTREGRVKDAKIIKSKPANIFDNAAMRAVLSWRFQPRMRNGRAIEVRAQQQLDFKLRGMK